MASMGEWLVAGGTSWLKSAALVTLLIVAAWTDVRTHRIPNWLVFSGVAIALLMAHLPGGSISAVLVGIVVGIAMALPLYWLGAMGAGDVKLIGMVGGFVGGSSAFAAVLVIFVIGGVLGLATVARRRAVSDLVTSMKSIALAGPASVALARGDDTRVSCASVGGQPYAIAIALGTVVYLVASRGGLFQ